MIRSAVIGYGYIGKRHAQILNNNNNVELVAVIDIDESALKKAKHTFPEVNVYKNLIHAIHEENIDVIHICTPNGLHYEHTKIALLNNINVICEKPVSLYYEQILELIDIAKTRNLYFESVLQNRLSPTSQFLKHLIETDLLEPFYVKVNCFWNRDENYYKNGDWRGTQHLDGGVLYTQFSHFIDILIWLFGEITPTNINLWNLNHHYLGEDWYDSGEIIFKSLNNNIVGSLSFSTSCYKKNLESSITILGNKGTIKVGGQYMERIEHLQAEHTNGTPNLPTPKANSYPNWQGSANNHAEFIQNYYEKIIRQIPPNYNDIKSASLGIKFIQEVYSKIPLKK